MFLPNLHTIGLSSTKRSNLDLSSSKLAGVIGDPPFSMSTLLLAVGVRACLEAALLGKWRWGECRCREVAFLGVNSSSVNGACVALVSVRGPGVKAISARKSSLVSLSRSMPDPVGIWKLSSVNRDAWAGIWKDEESEA